jgi:VanZ family protein
MTFSRFAKYWLPLLVWVGFIFAGSTDLLSAENTYRFLAPLLRWLQPDISIHTIAKIHFLVRKTGHLVEYAILAALLWRAFWFGISRHLKMPALFVVVCFCCVVFAASDEFHQSFFPSRTASSRDVIIDSIGAVAGLAIYLLFTRAKNVRRNGREITETPV